MWSFITFVNMLALVGVYTPIAVDLIRGGDFKIMLILRILIIKMWWKKTKTKAIETLNNAKLSLYQWWNNTTETLDKEEGMYILTHFINGVLIRVVVQMKDIDIINVKTPDDVDLSDELIPFLKATPLQFDPAVICGEDKLTVTLKNGKINTIES